MFFGEIYKKQQFQYDAVATWVNGFTVLSSRIGALGLFETVENKWPSCDIGFLNGMLQYIPTTNRDVVVHSHERGVGDLFRIPIKRIVDIFSVSVEDVFRQAGMPLTVTGIERVNEQTEAAFASLLQAGINRAIGVINNTTELQRAWALRGRVVSAKADTPDNPDVIYNLYEKFGIPEPTPFEVDFNSATFSADDLATDVINAMSRGPASARTGIIGLCGIDFFKQLKRSPSVQLGYLRFEEGSLYRSDVTGMPGFNFGGINWICYPDPEIWPANEARFVPTGVPGLLTSQLAPSTSGMTGFSEYYVLQEQKNKGRTTEVEVERCALEICTAPQVLYRAISAPVQTEPQSFASASILKQKTSGESKS